MSLSAPAPLHSREHMTVIGPDSLLKGEMAFDTGATILGRVEGRIVATGDLHIGESAVCKASLDAARIVIDGRVEGDIVARERLDLHPGAIVAGDIIAATLVVADGACFIGHCRVGEVALKEAGGPGDTTAAPLSIEITRGQNGRGNGRATHAPTAPPTKPASGASIHVLPTSQHTQPAASDIEGTLAGFEAKLAEFSRPGRNAISAAE